MRDLWILSENSFDPEKKQHQEIIFTIANGYFSTRGAVSLICYG
jgi:trehalose/maltose hydrolase-like predicted phosphorylase